MPYINSQRREELDPEIESLQSKLIELGSNEGDLNYVITRLIAALFAHYSRYAMIARVSGVLANVGSEFYRRIAGPYEDIAVSKNEDIPEFKEILNKIKGA